MLWRKEGGSRAAIKKSRFLQAKHWGLSCFHFHLGNFPLITLLTGWVQTALGTPGLHSGPKGMFCAASTLVQEETHEHFQLSTFSSRLLNKRDIGGRGAANPNAFSPLLPSLCWYLIFFSWSLFPGIQGAWQLRTHSDQLSLKAAYKVRLFNLFTAAWPCHKEQITSKQCPSADPEAQPGVCASSFII